MTERRGANIAGIDMSQRPEFVARYAELLQRLLEQEFPAANDYLHRLDWVPAACVDERRTSPADQKRLQTARITVTRGRDWGFALTAGPADTGFKKVTVIVRGAVPIIEGAKRWVLTVAAGLALLTGLVGLGVSVWQEPQRPRTAFLVGMAFAAAVFLTVSFVGLLFLAPLSALFSSYRMRESIRSINVLVTRGWTEMQQTFPGMQPLQKKRSPTAFYFWWMLPLIVITALSYFISTSAGTSADLSIALIVVMCVAGLAAFAMLLGFIVSLLGVMKE